MTRRAFQSGAATAAARPHEHCLVCAEGEPKFWAISPCNHRICWVCSLRLRALYGSKACPICKTQNDWVVICKRGEDDYQTACRPNCPSNVPLGIYYEDEATKTHCETLLKIRCPFNHDGHQTGKPPCEQTFKNKHELTRHVQSAHNLLLCAICVAHRRCFSVELSLHTKASLQRHQTEGDVGAGMSAHPRGDHRATGHPKCTVCATLFYSEDELMEHCRLEHEQCHICQRATRTTRYFKDYAQLEEHFTREHYPCPEPLCRELKFIVFESELEYKKHLAEVHLAHSKLQRSERRHLQQLDVSFGFTTSGSSTRPGARPSARPGARPATREQPPLAPLAPQLTADQRVQIAASLVYGEVTDELAARMQSLSLYQQQNDQFIETLRGTHHLSQPQIQRIMQEARSFQCGKTTAADLVVRLDTALGSDLTRRLLSSLVTLQLDETRKRELNEAAYNFVQRCESFPAFPAASTRPTVNSSMRPKEAATRSAHATHPAHSTHPANSTHSMRPETEARKPTLFPVGDASVRVLHIRPPVAGTPSRLAPHADPSRNPSLLLPQLAGAPSVSGRKKKGPVALPTFSSAAIGSTLASVPAPVAVSYAGRVSRAQLDETQFPSLGKGATPSSVMDVGPAAPLLSVTPGNAFAAPSDRDRLESFTIGDAGEERQEEKPVAPPAAGPKRPKSKLVFRYGQSWNI